jgi:hypothetical protein
MIQAAGARICGPSSAWIGPRRPRPCRCTTPCWWWWGAAPPIRMPTPTWPRSPGCWWRASASAGGRPSTPGSPSPWWSRACARRCASASAHGGVPLLPVLRGAGEPDPPAHRAGRRRPSRCGVPPGRPTWATIPWCWTPSERVAEVLSGDTTMNCSLCKYRAQVLGFEREVGAPQHSHHHHVEGLGESCTLCERECTGACQPDGVPVPAGPRPRAAITMATARRPITTTRPIPTPTTPWVRAPCGGQATEGRGCCGRGDAGLAGLISVCVQRD